MQRQTVHEMSANGGQSDLLSMRDSVRDNPMRNLIEKASGSPYTKRPANRNSSVTHSKTIDAAAQKQLLTIGFDQITPNRQSAVR
jgi:hypothetical protein